MRFNRLHESHKTSISTKSDQIVIESLLTIAKGTGIIFIGTIIGMGLEFLNRLLIVRHISQYDYGLYSLSFTILGIFTTISLLGLPDGVARFLGYYRGMENLENIKGIIPSTLFLGICGSIIAALFLFFFSNVISIKVFHSPSLVTALRIFALGLPFKALILILISIYRGFGDVKPQVYFKNIMQPVFFLFLIFGVFLLNKRFLGVIVALVISIFLTFILFLKKFIINDNLLQSNFNIQVTNIKELMRFSIPLFFSSILGLILSQIDTLMLGYFKTPTEVALYNSAIPLVRLLPIILVSMAFLYTPIVSEMFSRKQIKEAERFYKVTTKWIFIFTYPIFLAFFAFPELILSSLFGQQYVGAALALQILSLGYITHVLFGLNGMSLICFGKTIFIMKQNMFVATSNVILNLLYIPSMGIKGAAIASTISYIMGNLIISIKLYLSYRIHPFTKNYTKLFFSSIAIIIMLRLLNYFITPSIWFVILIAICFLVFYFLLLLLTRSFGAEDITILKVIENKIGINVKPIKNILKRLIR